MKFQTFKSAHNATIRVIECNFVDSVGVTPTTDDALLN